MDGATRYPSAASSILDMNGERKFIGQLKHTICCGFPAQTICVSYAFLLSGRRKHLLIRVAVALNTTTMRSVLFVYRE